MSARRSARSHSTQNPPPPVQHTNSSTSISANSNGKAERNTRSTNRNTTPPRVPPSQRSESTDLTTTTRSETVAPRRSRRGNGDDKDKDVKQQDEDDDTGVNEEEVTRCICGQADYPGPSPRLRELNPTPDSLPDDVGNFFVQCDQCAVWQHGGCMGFSDEDMLPDQYYCEQCKPQCHKVSGGVTGLKYSRFLPVAEVSSRSSSLSSNAEPSKKRESKSRNSESTKKRATLNSRIAYDEAELLRQAIEESKEMGTLGKRGREESEELKQNLKRQKTTSRSPSVDSRQSQSPVATPDELGTRLSSKMKSAPKLRGAAARNNREKELRDKQKEQAAAQRAEAATKRAARTERRRGEDSPPPPPTPTLSPSKAVQSTTTNAKAKADTPPSSKATLNRKLGRPMARRGRLGRNQYTRDPPLNGDHSDTSMRDGSQDPHGSPHFTNGINGESGRSSKAKTHPARTSMNEMKRRVAAILEFVGRMQSEKRTHHSSQHSSGSASSNGGGTNTPNGHLIATGAKVNGDSKSSGISNSAQLLRDVEAGLKEAAATSMAVNFSSSESHKSGVVVGGDENKSPMENGMGGPSSSSSSLMKVRHDKDFGGMDSGQMMEVLTGELVQWQSVYGAYTR